MKYKTVTIHKVDLKKLCDNKNMSFAELARKAGIDPRNLSAYHKEYKTMSEETWNKIKQYL